MVYEAIKLRSGRWAVRPAKHVGTCGSAGGKLWQVQYVRAINGQQAIERAKHDAKVAESVKAYMVGVYKSHGRTPWFAGAILARQGK